MGVDNYKRDSDIGDRKFTIGHEFYNESLCEVKALKPSPLRKVIENYKKLCKCTSIMDFKQTGIDIKSINNADHYKQYYRGLGEDIELKEFDAGDSERAFFFIDPARKIIQMIALRNGHTETKKNKK
jgi:hypothetical protein